MKTLELTDEQYEALHSLVKELQTQPNWSQAFPYFWMPSSEKLTPNINDEGDVITIYDCNDSETFSLEEYAEHNEQVWKKHLWNQDEIDTKQLKDMLFEPRTYVEEDDAGLWEDYLRHEEPDLDIRIYTEDWKRQEENNPSLFLSDVKEFCESNSHHLGRNPKPYSSSIWRMPKMERFIKSVMELFPMEEDSNSEIKTRVYGK